MPTEIPKTGHKPPRYAITIVIIKAQPSVDGNLDDMGAGMSVGQIERYYGLVPPEGWLLCDGGSYMNKSYPELATCLSARFGGTKPPSKWWRFVGLKDFMYRRWMRSGIFNVPDFRSSIEFVEA